MKHTVLAVTQFLWVGVLCGASAQPRVVEVTLGK